MATLSPKQLDALRHDLHSLANIRYDHLREELLDHYATLTEMNLAAGQSFYKASTAAWAAMGNGTGIQRIQDEYETVTKEQIKARHKEIMWSYLRWPIVAITLLTGVLITLIFLSLPVRPARLMAIILVISPIFVLLATAYVHHQRKNSCKKLVWAYIVRHVNWPIALLNIFSISTTSHPPSAFGTIALLLMAVGSLYYTVSLAQLTREHFYHKPALQP